MRGVGVRYLLHQKGVPKRFSSQELLGYYETYCEDDDCVTWTTRKPLLGQQMTSEEERPTTECTPETWPWKRALSATPSLAWLFSIYAFLPCQWLFFPKCLLICCYIVLVQHVAVCVKLGSRRNLCCPLFLPSWLAEWPRVPPAPQEEYNTNG